MINWYKNFVSSNLVIININGRLILLIIRITTDRIGLYSVLLPLLRVLDDL